MHNKLCNKNRKFLWCRTTISVLPSADNNHWNNLSISKTRNNPFHIPRSDKETWKIYPPSNYYYHYCYCNVGETWRRLDSLLWIQIFLWTGFITYKLWFCNFHIKEWALWESIVVFALYKRRCFITNTLQHLPWQDSRSRIWNQSGKLWRRPFYSRQSWRSMNHQLLLREWGNSDQQVQKTTLTSKNIKI